MGVKPPTPQQIEHCKTMTGIYIFCSNGDFSYDFGLKQNYLQIQLIFQLKNQINFDIMYLFIVVKTLLDLKSLLDLHMLITSDFLMHNEYCQKL